MRPAANGVLYRQRFAFTAAFSGRDLLPSRCDVRPSGLQGGAGKVAVPHSPVRTLVAPQTNLQKQRILRMI